MFIRADPIDRSLLPRIETYRQGIGIVDIVYVQRYMSRDTV